MPKLKLAFKIDGKQRVFKAPNLVTGEVLQEALTLDVDIQKGRMDSLEVIERSYPLICSIYGHQFTERELREGLDINRVFPTLNAALEQVIAHMRLTHRKPSPVEKGKVIPFDQKRSKR